MARSHGSERSADGESKAKARGPHHEARAPLYTTVGGTFSVSRLPRRAREARGHMGQSCELAIKGAPISMAERRLELHKLV